MQLNLVTVQVIGAHLDISQKDTGPRRHVQNKGNPFFSGKSFSSILHGAPESGKTVPHTSLRQGRIEFSPPKRIVFFFMNFCSSQMIVVQVEGVPLWLFDKWGRVFVERR